MPSPALRSSSAEAICTRCGARVPGGTEGCQRLFQELLAREYSHFAYAAAHLLTVDAYVLQHPEDHGPHSNAVHLLRLCMLLEHGGRPEIGWNPHWFRSQIQSGGDLPVIHAPVDRGEVTIVDMQGAGPDEYLDVARRWARSVWEAYGAHHGWARQWLAKR